MAFADLILGAVIIPYYSIYVFGDEYSLWTITKNSFFHTVFLILSRVFFQASPCSAAMISVERFYAIYWPRKYRTLSKRAYGVAIFILWTLSFVVSMSFVVTSQKHATYATAPYFLILLFIVCGCNIGTWRKFQHGRIASQQQNRDLQNQRLTKTLMFVSIVALLSWFPFIVVSYVSLKPDISLPTVFYVAVVFNFSNLFLNPVVYALRIPEFRQALGLCSFRRQAAMDNTELANVRGGHSAVALTPVTLPSLASTVLGSAE